MNARLILVSSNNSVTDTFTVRDGEQIVVTRGETFQIVDENGIPIEYTSRWIGDELVVNLADDEGTSFSVQGIQNPGDVSNGDTNDENSEVTTGEVIPEVGEGSENDNSNSEQEDPSDISFGDDPSSNGSVENLVAGIATNGGNSLMRFSDGQTASFGGTSQASGYFPTSHLGSGGTPPTFPIGDTSSEPGAPRSSETARRAGVIPPRPRLSGTIGGPGDPDESDRPFAPGTNSGEVKVTSIDTGNMGSAQQSIFGSRGELIVNPNGTYEYFTDLGSGSGRDVYLVEYPVLNDDDEEVIVTETLIFEWVNGVPTQIAPDISNGPDQNFFDDPDNESPDLEADPNLDDEIESSILVESIDNDDPEEGENPAGGIGDAVDGDHGFIVVSQDGTYDYVMDYEDPLEEGETETFTLTYIDENGKKSVETLVIVGTAEGAEIVPPISGEVGEPTDIDDTDPSIDPDAEQGDIIVKSLDTDDSGIAGEIVDGPRGDLVFNEDGSFDYMPEPGAEPGIDTFTVTYPIDGEGGPVTETLIFETFADGTAAQKLPDETIDGSFYDDPDNNVPGEGDIIVKSLETEETAEAGNPVSASHGTLVFNENGTYDYLANPDSPLAKDALDTFTITYTDENGKTTVETLTFIGDGEGSADLHDPYSVEIGGEGDPDETNPQVHPDAEAGDIVVTSLDTDDSGPAGELVDGPRGDLLFNEDGTFDYIPQPGAEPGVDTFTVTYPPIDGGDPVTETLTFETKDDGTVELVVPDETIDGSFYDDPDNNVPGEGDIVVTSLESGDTDEPGQPVKSSHGTLVFNTDGTYDYIVNPDSPLAEDALDTFTITYTDENDKTTVETLTFIGDGEGSADLHDPYSVEIGGEGDPDETNPQVHPDAEAGDIVVTSLDTEDSGPAGELVDGPRGDLLFNEDGTFDYIPQPGAEPGVDTFTVTYPPIDGGDPVTETLTFETKDDGTVELVVPDETIDGSFYDDPDNNVPGEGDIVVTSLESGDTDEPGQPVKSSHGTLVFNTDGTYDYIANPDSPLAEDALDTFTVTYTDENGKTTVETLTFIGDGEGSADLHDPYSVEIGGEGDPDDTNPPVHPDAEAGDIVVTSLDTEDSGPAGELVDGPRGDLLFNEDGTFDYIPQPGAEPGVDTFTVTYPPIDGGDPVTETLTFETKDDGTVELVVPDETIDGSFYDDPDNNVPGEGDIEVKSLESGDTDEPGQPVKSSHGTLVFNTDGTYDYIANPDSPLAEDALDTFTVTYTDENGKTTVETLTFIGDGEGSADLHDPYSIEIGGEGDPDETNPPVHPDAEAGDIVVTSLDTEDSGPAGELVDGPRGDLLLNEDGTFDYIPQPGSDPGVDTFTVTYPPVDGGDPVTETLTFETKPDGTVELIKPSDTIEGDFFDDTDNPTPDGETDFVVASVETEDSGDAGEPVSGGHGILVFNTDGTYDYVLDPDTPLGEDETDEFTVTYTDEDGNETVETLTFTGDGEGGATEVQPTSSAIEEADDSENPSVKEGTTPEEIKVVSLNTNDMGTAGELVDGDIGTLIFNPDGTFDFVLDEDAPEGVDTYVVTYPTEDGPVSETLTFSYDGEGNVETLDPVSAIIGGEGDPDETNPPVADNTDPGEIEVSHPESGEEGEALEPVKGDFGVFVVNPDGTFDYVPSPDAPEGSEDTFLVTFPTEDGPVTETFTFEFPGEGEAVLVQPDSAGDLDLPDESPEIEGGFPITVTSEETGDSGKPGDPVVGDDSDIVFNEDGTFDINLHPDSEAEDGDTETFTVSYFDGEGEKVSQDIVVEYDGGGVNVLPFAADEFNAATEDGPNVTGDLVGYDVDSDGTVTFSGGGEGTHGTLTIDDAATGEYSYAVANESAVVQSLAAGETITDTFTYTVEDNEGGFITKDIAITVTGINDNPVGGNDVIALNEDSPVTDTGSLVAGSGNGLLANDSDVDGSDTHRISQIEVNGVTHTIPSGSSTTVVLGNGELTVGSDGSYEFDPADGYEFLNIDDPAALENFSYTVVDNNGGSAASGVTFQVSGVNDAPVIESNTVAVTEGEYSPITENDILVTDVDDDPTDLSIVAENVEGGTFVDSEGDPIAEFTMQDIINGNVGFQHDGSETPAAWSLTATDPGGLADTDSFDSATDAENPFTFVNDAPVIDINSAPITEGEITLLDETHIHTIDPDNSDNELTYKVDSVVGGEFQNPVTGVAISEFTQKDINDGRVQFAHDGSETPPAWSLTVDDGELEDSSYFNGATDEENPFVPVNDGPVIVNNSAPITEGGTTPITLAEISAIDPDNADDELTFTVSDVLGGQFEDPDAPGTEVTTFTQQDITDGNLQFVHDGGEVPASWEIEVSDGTLTDESTFDSAADSDNPYTAVNDAPVIDANSAPITEGETTVLNGTHIHATDPDNSNDELTYSVDFVAGGEFQNSVTGQPLSKFTQEDINGGKVQFAHDGSETVPAWSLTVDDGELEDSSDFSGATDEDNPYVPMNDGPVIENNSAAITEGATTLITLAEISAVDPDHADDELTFTVSEVLGGQFEDPSAEGTEITSFTQQDIADGKVQFVHDGSEVPASWEIEVSDGTLSDESSFNSATDSDNPYTAVNDAPVIDANSAPITEGEATVLNATHIHATDPDNTDLELKYNVDSVTAGQFQNVVTGAPVSSFTQDDINHGRIQFVHDGSETPAEWTLSVNDGELSDSDSFTSSTGNNTFIPVNDAPVATPATNSVTEATDSVAASVVAGSVLATDAESDELTFTTASAAAYGTLTLNVDGSYSYSLDNTDASVNSLAAGEDLTETFNISVSDGNGGFDTTTLTITIEGSNDSPVVTADTATYTENQSSALTGNVLSNDSDPEGGSLAIASVNGNSGGVGTAVEGAYGSLTLNSNGSWSYSENSNIEPLEEGQDVVETFTFEVSDGNGGITSSKIDITISGENDAPNIVQAIPDFVALPAGDEPIIQGPGAPPSDSNFSIVDANALATAQIANSLIGAGVTVQGVSFSGQNDQVGTFVNASKGIPGVLEFDDGVVFSTGTVQSIEGGNTADDFSAGPDLGGYSSGSISSPTSDDPDLGEVYDLSKMTITFIPEGSYIVGQYVFGSEEYNEFVGSNFKDSAGIFVNNQNVSLTPDGQPLSIATINGGNGATVASNPDLYIDNDIDDTGAPYQTQMDGFTKTLTFVAKVIPDVVNTIEIAIGDVGDPGFDSWFLVKAGSLSSIEPVAIDLDLVFDDIDSDDDGSTLSYSIQQSDGSPVPSWITLDGNEIFGIPPLDGEEFDYTIQAVATDQHGNETVEEFRVASNTTAKDDSGSTDESTPITLDVLDNDFDPEGDALTISEINGEAISDGQTVTITSGATVTLVDGELVYDPNGQFTDLSDGDIYEDIFKYTMTDGTNESSSRVTVEINGNSVTPVVVDLDGDGAEFLGIEGGIEFDVDGDGVDEQTAWAGNDDAVLVYDADDNNDVDGRSEVAFSDYSDNPDATDLEGLLYFDTDDDNRLDAGDEEFAKFKLWQDADGDGDVGDGEMMTLEEAGIESIDLISDGISYTAAEGDVLVHGEAAVNYADGSNGIAADAEFNYAEMLTEGGEGDVITAMTSNGGMIEIESVTEAVAIPDTPDADGIESGSFAVVAEDELAAAAAAASA